MKKQLMLTNVLITFKSTDEQFYMVDEKFGFEITTQIIKNERYFIIKKEAKEEFFKYTSFYEIKEDDVLDIVCTWRQKKEVYR